MHVLLLFIILRPDYINLNLYSYILNKLLLGPSLGIAVINAVVNKYFGGMLGGMGNNLNIILMYLFFYAGSRFSRG